MSTSPAAMLRAAGRAARALAGGSLGTPGGVVLAYHDVGDDPSEATIYSVTPAQLRRHLTDATRWGLRFVDLAELTSRVVRGESVDGLVAVAFDDSLAGVHHHAMPILAELGVPATVFAVSDLLGQSPPWWSGAARVMTERELAEWSSAGFRVASHTCTHRSLIEVGSSDLRHELVDSRSRLQDLTGDDLDVFAYPYGHFDATAVDAVASAGYGAAYIFLNGRLVPGLDRFRLPRLCMGGWQGRIRLAVDLGRGPDAWEDTQRPEHRG